MIKSKLQNKKDFIIRSLISSQYTNPDYFQAVAGSDIAELLLKDHEVLRPPSLALKQILEVPQGEHSPADNNDTQSHGGDTSSPDEGIVVLHDKTILNNSGTVDVDKITRKFREFLLFGHKKVIFFLS